MTPNISNNSPNDQKLNLRVIISDSDPTTSIALVDLADLLNLDEVINFPASLDVKELPKILAKTESQKNTPAVLITNPRDKHGTSFSGFLSKFSNLFSQVQKALVLVSGYELDEILRNTDFGLTETNNKITFRNTHKKDANEQIITLPVEEIQEQVIKNWHQKKLQAPNSFSPDRQFSFDDFINAEKPIPYEGLAAVLGYLDKTLNQESNS